MHDDDDKFDDFLRGAARDYNAPVTPRADAIWAAIESDVAQAIAPRRQGARTSVLWFGAAIAATLVVGVSVGRWSTLQAPARPLATAAAVVPDSANTPRNARAITLEHLAEAEVFLTTVRSELKSGVADTERAERSRDLLVRTRVLLGGAQSRPPEVARLLEDLELLLAEIAALPANPGRSRLDQTLINESMREGDIIPRIRATLPGTVTGN